MISKTARTPSTLRLAAVLAAPLLLIACSGSQPAGEDAIDSSLTHLTDPSVPKAKLSPNGAATDPSKIDIAAMTEQAALDIQEILNNPRGPGADIGMSALPADAKPPRREPIVSAEPYKPAADVAAANAEWTQLTQPKATPAPPPAPSTGDQLVDLGKRIAQILRHRNDPAAAALPDPLALAALESLQPGVLSQLDDPKSPFRVALGEDDARVLIDARDRVAANPASAATASELIAKSLSRFAPAGTLKIAHPTLCTRVMGFGRFEPFQSDTFLVGKPIRALVYCEIDGFGHRPVRDSDPGAEGQTNAVELSQTLTLYLLTSGPESLQAWHSPEKTVIETSRNVRKDFYLVQQIDLPAGLSMGRYNLKVIIKDKTSGAQSETMIPVNIVADPTLATAGT
jgi:hypothetical protein